MVLSAASAGPNLLDLDDVEAPDCVDRASLRRALENVRSATLQLVLTSTTNDGVRLTMKLSAPDRSAAREFELRRGDCPLAEALILRVWRRFVEDLPVPPPPPVPAFPPELQPGWIHVESWSLAVESSPSSRFRWGARLTREAGSLLEPRGHLGLGYDLVDVSQLGIGRAWIHAASVHGGLTLDAQRWGWPLEVRATVMAGVSLSVGDGFPSNQLQAHPVLRGRLMVAGRLPRRGDGGRVEVGVGVEGSPFDLRLVGIAPEAVYQEPTARLVLTIAGIWETWDFRNEKKSRE